MVLLFFFFPFVLRENCVVVDINLGNSFSYNLMNFLHVCP